MDLEDVKLTHKCGISYDSELRKWLAYDISEDRSDSYVSIHSRSRSPSLHSFEEISDCESDVKIQRPMKRHLFAEVGQCSTVYDSIDDWLIKPTPKSSEQELVSFACCRVQTGQRPCSSFEECACSKKSRMSNCASRLISSTQPDWNAWLVKQPEIPSEIKQMVAKETVGCRSPSGQPQQISDELIKWLSCCDRTGSLQPQQHQMLSSSDLEKWLSPQSYVSTKVNQCFSSISHELSKWLRSDEAGGGVKDNNKIRKKLSSLSTSETTLFSNWLVDKPNTQSLIESPGACSKAMPICPAPKENYEVWLASCLYNMSTKS